MNQTNGQVDSPNGDIRPVPGWLASLVLHLVLLSLFLSFPAPVFMPPHDRAPLIIQGGFAGTPVKLASVAIMQPPAEIAKQQESVAAELPTDWQDVAARKSAVKPSRRELSDHQRPVRPPSPPSTLQVRGPIRASQLVAESQLPLAAHWVPQRPSGAKRPGEYWPADRELAEMDEIVDRFIQYDIGQLSGTAGQRALQEFQALGPESVQSLVRGLNKAARIQYTCPVGVLSAKLVQLVLQSKDSGLQAYVAKHLGEGVPTTAPHQRRLEQLRGYIAAQVNKAPQPMRNELRRRQLPFGREMIQLVDDMIVISVDQLVEAIRVGDPISQVAAVLGVVHRADRLTPAERLQVGNMLVIQFANQDPESAKLTHEALVKLANGLDFGDQPSDAAQWADYWRGMDKSQAEPRRDIEFGAPDPLTPGLPQPGSYHVPG